MQNPFLKFASLVLVVAAVFITGCGEDEDPIPGGGNDLPPIVRFETGTGFLTFDADIEVGSPFSVQLTGVAGDGDLSSLRVTENGATVSTSNLNMVITVTSTSEVISNNPLSLNAFPSGFTFDITFSGASKVVGDVSEYVFTLTDANSLTANVSLTITTVAPPGTPLDMELNGILLNQAGPSGQGALDLDTGMSTGTGSAGVNSELRDMGIDCTIPVATENWVAQFGTINGAVMRKVDASQLEDFTFDKVDTKEVIVDAYNTGTELGNAVSTAPDCSEITVTDVATAPAVGDMYVVFANDTYYLIEVDEINILHSATVPTERNIDNFVFSIKY
ncbi:MAG: hypothetical protein AAF798_02065 [Bacteroidota bacterium]